MRFRWHMIALAIIVIACAASDASAQTGPSLLPPPSEPPSEPWSPPAAVPPASPEPTVAEEALPTPTGEAANIDTAAEAAGLAEGDLLDNKDTEPNWYQPRYWIDPLPWNSGIELGLNGSSGTRNSFSIRTGGYMKRESRFSKLDMSLYYNSTTAGENTTQNNAQYDVRNDWLLDDKSPWTLFGSGNVFYDQFQAFDIQANANTGIGYRFANEPNLKVIGRFGGGTSREFGGPDDRWVPEALFGWEYSQKLYKTQRLYGKLDYFPQLDELEEFRVVADAGWEVELVQPSNMSLKVSANDRYDSTPNGAQPHLVNYSVLLLIKL